MSSEDGAKRFQADRAAWSAWTLREYGVFLSVARRCVPSDAQFKTVVYRYRSLKVGDVRLVGAEFVDQSEEYQPVSAELDKCLSDGVSSLVPPSVFVHEGEYVDLRVEVPVSMDNALP